MDTNKNIRRIRNFAIIAHIDHGKSTLADRLIETTGTIAQREMKDRVLDTLELEQERGITIKLQTARMEFLYSGEKEEYKSDLPYILNLVDTPGHVDFSYEVSRSLAAAEGAVLLVDATQGVQAQTLTTVYKAFEYNLEIVPVINKVDLGNAEVDRVVAEMCAVFGFKPEDIVHASGKTGLGVNNLLNRIVESVPAPANNSEKPTRALVYDSFFDEHKGVVALVKIQDGQIRKGDQIKMFGTKLAIDPIEIGYLRPHLVKGELLNTGEIGYIATGLKDIRSVHVGDTVTLTKYAEQVTALEGYMPPKPMVFASLFPVDADDFPEFQESVEKLALNDPAITYQKEHSAALGSGFSCGYLGLLHMEITQERLEREFNINLITTSPSVEYKLELTTKDYSKIPGMNTGNIDSEGLLHIKTAAEYPDPTLINSVYEPWVKLEILTPEKYMGGIMELAINQRGVFKGMDYITNQHIAGEKHLILKFEIPTAEIITTFFDKLKSLSQGYASMDYNFLEFRKSEIVKVSILLNGERVEALSFLSHRSSAERRGRDIVSKLAELIPRQQFKIPVQAAISGKVIARETIAAFRKDVTAKLYGGDITRKKKLLKKQKKGKAKMKMIGKVELPKEVFIKALKAD